MKNVIRFAAVFLGVIFFSTIYASAGDLTIPNTFAADTPAVAADVNANFTAVETEVDDNAADIATNASAIAAHAGDSGIHLGPDSVGSAEIADNSVTTSEIVNGTITNNDISSSAAISASKIYDGVGSGLNADYLDGVDGLRYVRDNGDTMTGNYTINGDLTVDSVVYNTARTHYYSVGPVDFVPYGDDPLINNFGNGGVYVSDGSGYIFAGVHLPHGAAITTFTVYFYDADATANLKASLWGEYLTSAFQVISLDETTSSGSGGAMNVTDSTINHTVNNSTLSYFVRVDSDPFGTWSSNLRVRGVRIGYTISEAP
jgi:hypothetical protein